jgi:uncharacterized protein (DUF2062 family)
MSLHFVKDMSETAKHNLDFAAVGVIVGTFFSWLPHLAALAAFVWWCIRIYETRAVQHWLGNPLPKERSDD